MRNALSKVLSFPGTRIGRWVVIVSWLILMGAIGPVAGKLEQVTSNEQSSWLPQSVESVKALKIVNAAQKDQTLPTIIVYNRTSGLTAEDKKAIQSDIVALSTPPTAPKTLAKTEIAGRTVPAVSPQPVYSKDGQAAIVALSLKATGEGNDILDSVDQIRKVVHEGPPGLRRR